MPLIVTPGELNRRAELYHQLGSMVAAGMPLIKALEMVSTRRGLAGSPRTFRIIIQQLKAGQTFTDSMMSVHGWLSEFDKALLSVGEKTGRLDSSFKVLGLYYASRAKLIRDTIAGLIITIATLHVFLLIIPLRLWIQFAMGLINNNYSECIPYLIQKGVVFGALYGGVFLFIFACQGERGESWRAFVESVARWIPILGTARKYLTLSRVTGALEALNNAGVAPITAWPLAAAAGGSPHLRRQVAGWKHELEAGTTPAELVNRTDYFPSVFANLYDTGEQSGKLDETLQRLQAYYQEEGFRTLRLFTRIMNGIIYGSIALTIALYIINFWSNYYGGLNQVVNE